MTARSYVVGLPVVVEVDESGRVTFEVDLFEAATSLVDDEEAAERYTDHERIADVASVTRAVDLMGGYAVVAPD